MSLTTMYESFSMGLRDAYRVEVYPVGANGRRIIATHTPTGDTVQGVKPFMVFGDVGEWRMELPPTSELSPAGTRWARDMTGSGIDPADEPKYFEVPVSASPEDVNDHLSDPPGDIGGAALDIHATRPLLAGLHGVQERSWERDGTTGLNRLVMSQDGSNAITASVVGKWLRFNSAAAGGNQREAWVIPGTEATDCEHKVLFGPSDALGVSVAQWGLMSRVQWDAAAQLWRAFVVWTDTTIPVPTLLNHGVITFTGGPTFPINNAGQNGVASALTALRYLPLHRLQRTSNVVTGATSRLHLPSVGQVGNVVSNTATGFHITGATVTAVDRNLGTWTWAQTAANATDADAGGQWQPSTLYATIPFWLAVRHVGNTLTSKFWRREEPEPDWSDTDRVTSFTFSSGSPAAHSGKGSAALWVAHLANNNMRFGDYYHKKLA